MPLFRLCSLEELDEPDSRGFVISDVSPERNIFIVKNRLGIFAYENRCPHNAAPLDWVPGQFLDFDKEYIQCANHGALFELHNGHCIYGPCSGQFLEQVNLKIKDNWIFASI